NIYKKAEQLFWCADGVNFEQDVTDYNGLKPEEKKAFNFVIDAFKQRLEGGVVNLSDKFMQEVQYPEARCFYGFQSMMRSNHLEAIGIIQRNVCVENSEIPSPKYTIRNSEYHEWIKNNFEKEQSFSVRVLASAIIQKIFYSQLHSIIANFRERKILNNSCMLLDFIFIDENIYVDFDLSLYTHLKNKIDIEKAKTLISESVRLELDFINTYSTLFESAGIDKNKLIAITKYNADIIMFSLHKKTIYGSTTNPEKRLYWDRCFVTIDSNKDWNAELAKQEAFREIRFDADF
ncbi:MAG: ribonucleotide-diphosphate reductase subunit beta, partial [Nanoarchaeota archaeon]